jgi:hypothetical protein
LSERTIYKPGNAESKRRREWVTLPGGDICVWELTMSESAQIVERSARPAIDPRGGQVPATFVALQILFCCYDGEEDNAKRIFSEADLLAIYCLPFSEFDLLLGATNRVNGKDATELERLRDFTAATKAQSPSG